MQGLGHLKAVFLNANAHLEFSNSAMKWQIEHRALQGRSEVTAPLSTIIYAARNFGSLINARFWRLDAQIQAATAAQRPARQATATLSNRKAHVDLDGRLPAGFG